MSVARHFNLFRFALYNLRESQGKLVNVKLSLVKA